LYGVQYLKEQYGPLGSDDVLHYQSFSAEHWAWKVLDADWQPITPVFHLLAATNRARHPYALWCWKSKAGDIPKQEWRRFSPVFIPG